MEYLQIRDFAKRIGKHTNTVDNWFKTLEERGIHFVQRVHDQKVYDELDMKIGQFIYDKRNDNWSMDGIMDILSEHCEIRPFPPSEEPVTPQTFTPQMLQDAIRQAAEQIAAARIDEMREMYEGILQRLPSPVTEQEARQQRVTELVTERRVITKLEDEAFKLWDEQPADIRFKSAGLFRKTEDLNRRDNFVRAYVNEHFEERLRTAYGVEDSK